MAHYRDLIVWQKAMDMADSVYDLTATFPEAERYGLISQMRRCAISVPSNIAEGHARAGTREFLQFISFAKGSVAELETQLIFAQRRGWVKEDVATNTYFLCEEINRMLTATQKSLKQRTAA